MLSGTGAALDHLRHQGAGSTDLALGQAKLLRNAMFKNFVEALRYQLAVSMSNPPRDQPEEEKLALPSG
jgi:hypothetical protein